MFDYYIYCEDDVLITKENFETFVNVQKNLPPPYVCGFLRYELKDGDDYKYLIDCHPAHSCHRGGGKKIIKDNYTINGKSYFEPYNIHQGSHILANYVLEAVSLGKNSYFKKESHYAGVLEGAASDVYLDCGLIKVIPRDDVSKLLTHHLPNKYVKMLPDIYIKDTTPDDRKIMELER